MRIRTASRPFSLSPDDDILCRCRSNGIGTRRDVGGDSDSSIPVRMPVQFGVMLTRRQIQEGDVE